MLRHPLPPLPPLFPLLLVLPLLLLPHAYTAQSPELHRSLHKQNSISGYYRLDSQLRAGHRKCKERAFDLREEDAEVIFTGTVKTIEAEPASGPSWAPRSREQSKDLMGKESLINEDLQRAQVEVKRVLKGVEELDRIPLVYGTGSYVSARRRLVTVCGLGRSDVCHSYARTQDTWIFFVIVDQRQNCLTLNSSLLRLTLDNIAKTEAAVKDKPWSSRNREDKTDSCEEQMFCPFGGQCVAGHQPSPSTSSSSSSSSPFHCTCVDRCVNDTTYSPVCGTDDVTYISECQMRTASCLQQKRIRIQRRAACSVIDPCAEKRCLYGAQCVPSTDGLTARCVCQYQCDGEGEGGGGGGGVKVGGVVCGSDDNDYTSVCHLKRSSCQAQREIYVKSQGHCGGACGVCKYGAKCTKSGVCGCPRSCPIIESPVCANDSVTYQNECAMLSAGCHYNLPLQVVHPGDCEDLPNSPDSCDVSMCQFGGECKADSDGYHSCVCNFNCDKSGRTEMTCGSDGQIYKSSCLLREASCQKQAQITVQPMKTCQRLQSKTTEGSCHCNPLGSVGSSCDPITKQCICRPAVGGLRCDRCQPNYWGLPKIAQGQSGCTPCECNVEGSIREDCQQMTGHCVCKPNWTGQKCDQCQSSTDCSRSAVDRSTAEGNETGKAFRGKVNKELPTNNNNVLQSTQMGWTVPFFAGQSYIQLTKLHHGSREVSISVEFVPRSAIDGLMLYTAQNENGMKGDFLIIALHDNHALFSYDLGSGSTVIRSTEPVLLNQLNMLTASRYGSDGFLQLNSGDVARGNSPGLLRSLNIGTPLYLGGTPHNNQQSLKNTGISAGFTGCIRSLRIVSNELNKEYDLAQATSADIEIHSKITDCHDGTQK